MRHTGARTHACLTRCSTRTKSVHKTRTCCLIVQDQGAAEAQAARCTQRALDRMKHWCFNHRFRHWCFNQHPSLYLLLLLAQPSRGNVRVSANGGACGSAQPNTPNGTGNKQALHTPATHLNCWASRVFHRSALRYCPTDTAVTEDRRMPLKRRGAPTAVHWAIAQLTLRSQKTGVCL